MSHSYHRFQAYRLIDIERESQDRKWGEQSHSDQTWYMILAEEMGELATALFTGKDGNAADELVQVAAVAVAWMEAVSRRLESDPT